MFELAGYETLDLIGGGGFGEVWLACQNSTGRNVAVKVAHAPISDETLQIRFEREYKALGRLSGHPNIVDIVTAGTLDDGRAYLVLEFIEGGTLWDKAQTERIPEERLLNVGLELAKALDAAHTAGVLHRDIKPENILLRESGEAVVSDFGLAHLRDGATTSPNAVVASVAYAAPEILRGEGATTATDIYGLGVCLLTAATQSVPFVELTDKSIQTVIKRVLTVEPTSITTIGYSELFGSLVSELLAKDASQRPNNAADLVRRFAEIPDLQRERDFSWSDLLGAPEQRILSTGEMPAISVQDNHESADRNLTDTDPSEKKSANDTASPKPSDIEPSSSDQDNGVPSSTTSESSSTPTEVQNSATGTVASNENLDDVDRLILELTSTGDTTETSDEPLADDATANFDGPPQAATSASTLDDKPTHDRETTTETQQSGSDHPTPAETQSDTESNQPDPDHETPKATQQSDTESNQPDPDHETPSAPVEAPVSDATTEMAAISIEALAPMTKPKPKPPAGGEPISKEVLSHIDQGARHQADKNSTPIKQASEKEAPKKQPATANTASKQPCPDSEPASPEEPAGTSSAESDPPPLKPDSDGPLSAESPLDRILIPAKEKDANKSAEKTLGPLSAGTPERDVPVEREKAEGWAKRIVLGIAIFVGLVVAIAALRSIFGPDPSGGSLRPGSGESTVTLPLTIDSVDLPAGTIEATTPSQGPVAPLFCDQRPDADGLLGWKGSQLFTPENEASIEQLVVDFDQPESAQSYAESIVETTQCDSWTLARQTSIFTATTKEAKPEKTIGDQTLLFETTVQNASGDKTTTKTWLFVSDVDILVFSITAGDEDRLGELEPLATQAGEQFISSEQE